MGGDRRPTRSVVVSSGLLAVLALAALFVFRADDPTVLFEGSGDFGAVRVIERSDGLRELYAGAGRARQSAVYPSDPRHLELAYSRTAMIGPALVASDARMLFVGLGGGAMPTFVRQIVPRARLDVVEIDPLIVSAAAEWFGVQPDSAMTVHTADGRAFIEDSPPGRWDLVVLDAFSDTDIPRALTTRPFLEAVRRSLDPQGIVVSNLHTSAQEYEAMVATYLEVFPAVLLVPVSGRRQNILIATDRMGLDVESVVAAAREWSERVEPGFDLGALAEDARVARAAVGATVLEDGGRGPL
jgi:spermidine synthase